MWMYLYDPEMKNQSMEWCDISSPNPKKFKCHQSAQKVMVFFGLTIKSFSLIILNVAIPWWASDTLGHLRSLEKPLGRGDQTRICKWSTFTMSVLDLLVYLSNWLAGASLRLDHDNMDQVRLVVTQCPLLQAVFFGQRVLLCSNACARTPVLGHQREGSLLDGQPIKS